MILRIAGRSARTTVQVSNSRSIVGRLADGLSSSTLSCASARETTRMFAMRSACAPACTSFVTGRDLREVSSRARRGALAPRRAPTPDKEDLYFTLGVSPGASQEAVKRAYKRLAKQFHPDVCDAPDAEAKFNAVRSAYETLVAERGNLDNVGTEEWRAKWSAQFRQMRDVEQGRAKVNVRRRRWCAREGRDGRDASGGGRQPSPPRPPDAPRGGGTGARADDGDARARTRRRSNANRRCDGR